MFFIMSNLVFHNSEPEQFVLDMAEASCSSTAFKPCSDIPQVLITTVPLSWDCWWQSLVIIMEFLYLQGYFKKEIASEEIPADITRVWAIVCRSQQNIFCRQKCSWPELSHFMLNRMKNTDHLSWPWYSSFSDKLEHTSLCYMEENCHFSP